MFHHSYDSLKCMDKNSTSISNHFALNVPLKFIYSLYLMLIGHLILYLRIRYMHILPPLYSQVHLSKANW
jgi:hypothetical protein